MSPEPENEYTARAWLVILGAFTCIFCTVGFLNSFGVFEAYYATAQLAQESQSTIGWLGALAMFFLFAISTGAGAMVDIFGPKLMILTGSVGTVFAVMMTSLCTEFYQFVLAQGILLGISMALCTWPAVALVGQYIKKKRGAAMGIVLAGSSLGGIIWPIAIENMLPEIGFPWTMRTVGFIMIPLFAFSCVICQSPPKGQVPMDVDLEDMTGNDTRGEPAPEKKVDHKKEAMALFRQPSLHLLCLAMFLIYFGMFSPFFYTTSYAIEMGSSTTLAFYTICIINGASFLGRIVPGILADKFGRFNCCIISALSAGIIALCWTTVQSVAGLVIWSAAYGFASGGILSLQQACAAQVATGHHTVGLAIGTVAGSTAFSAMANVPISGALVQQYGYLSLSIFSGVSLLLGGVMLIVARLVQNRKLSAIL
ncbi:hypothetical protein N7486_001041 [Penicillium sp. IBT 16267x]|nr:hypothetical protein N7486_001041 [Penicillium sp. IBT 16267x]